MRIRFEDILARHQGEIYRFARALTHDREDAADVLQETFLRAFRAFPRLPEDSNHRAWLYRIAGRVASNLARSKRHRHALPIGSASLLAGSDGDPGSRLEAQRLARELRDAVRALPPRQRMALVQRKYEGLSYEEIAESLGCSEPAARAHVYQAMAKIRSRLGRDRGDRRPATGRGKPETAERARRVAAGREEG